MKVKQISVFVENNSGNLSDIVALLSEKNIDISAMSLADTTDFGIVRMIVSDTDAAVEVLKAKGLAVKCTTVTELGMEDAPGGLSKILMVLKKENIDIDYLYAFVGKDGENARTVMKVSDPDRVEEIFG